MNAPNTLLGLVLFVLLLMPGFAYSMVRDRSRAVPQRTALRDLVSIFAVSCVTGIVSLVFFLLAHLWFPGLTIDVGKLITEPRDYLAEEYLRVGLWFLAMLTLSVLMAALAASRWVEPLTRPLRLAPRRAPVRDHTSNQSAWWVLFTQHPEAKMHVGCYLDSGDYVAGWLFTYNNSAQDALERDMTLSAPISYRPAGEEHERLLEEVGAVSVSAAKIAFLTVAYVAGDGAAADERQLSHLRDKPAGSAHDARPAVTRKVFSRGFWKARRPR